jgi:hypothetical protein
MDFFFSPVRVDYVFRYSAVAIFKLQDVTAQEPLVIRGAGRSCEIPYGRGILPRLSSPPWRISAPYLHTTGPAPG